MEIEKQVGFGVEAVYIYFNPKEEKGGRWPCKIGKTVKDVEGRIHQQRPSAAFAYEPKIGLLIHTNNSNLIESFLHQRLAKHRIKNEWFLTSPKEVEELLSGCRGDIPLVESKEQVGHRLRVLRRKKGVSQSVLGKEIGLRQGTISDMERGKGRCTLDSVLAFVRGVNGKIIIDDCENESSLIELALVYHPDNIGKFDKQIEAKNKALAILKKNGLL